VKEDREEGRRACERKEEGGTRQIQLVVVVTKKSRGWTYSEIIGSYEKA